MSQILWTFTPNAEIRNPRPQQQAAATPLFLGPACSSQRPNTAADNPRNTMAMVKIQASCVCFQSAGADSVMPRTLVSGSLKTLNAYACPMLRWMARAAGGTSQRLNPGFATMFSLDRNPAITDLLQLNSGGREHSARPRYRRRYREARVHQMTHRRQTLPLWSAFLLTLAGCAGRAQGAESAPAAPDRKTPAIDTTVQQTTSPERAEAPSWLVVDSAGQT